MCESKLLPCPFCGGNAYIARDGDFFETLGFASCDDCECDGPLIERGCGESEIIHKWNARSEKLLDNT